MSTDDNASDWQALRQQFLAASSAWPNMELVLVSWPEGQPAPELPQDCDSMHAVPMGVSEPYKSGILDRDGKDIGEKGALCFGGPYDCRGDTPAKRYFFGAESMFITRRSFGNWRGNPCVIQDPDEESKCWERYKILAGEGALLLERTPGAVSKRFMQWRGWTRWQLALCEFLGWTTRIDGKPRRIPEIWIASARACKAFGDAAPAEAKTGDAPASAAELAARYSVNPEALRKRLDRERVKRLDCFIELDDAERKPHDPKHLYRPSMVQHVVAAMKAGGRKRPANVRLK